MTVRGNTFAFDWNNDGAFTGTLEDVTAYLIEPLQFAYGIDWASASERITPELMDVVLRNPDRHFSPDNGSSTIAGLVNKGRRCRWQFASGATYTLIDGMLNSYSQDRRQAEPAITFQVTDAWGVVGDQTISTAVYQGIRTGDAIGVILDTIGWTGARDIDSGNSVLPYWWVEDETGNRAVSDVLDAEGPTSRAWVQGGTFVFRDRLHRVTRAASQTSQATFTNVITPAGTGPGGSFKILDDTFEYQDGFENLFNSVSFDVEERFPIDPGTVWEVTDAALVVPASSTLTVHVKADDPFVSAITPTGSDLSVQSGSVTATSISRTSGQSLIITLTAGASGAVVTYLRLRATSLPVRRTVKVLEESAPSIAVFRGRYSWPRGCPYANVYDARDAAKQIIAMYAIRRPRVQFTIATDLGATYLTQALTRALSDRITVRDDDTLTNRDFWIERIQHRARVPGIGAWHEFTVWAEAADAASAVNHFRFGTAGAGFNQGVFA